MEALASIPETVHPGSYAALLPSLDEPETPSRYDDGLDDLELDEALSSLKERALADRNLLEPLWEEICDDVSAETLVTWYRDRALQMDARCGAVANSEALLSLAKQRLPAENYASLFPLHRDCWQLARLLALDALRDRRESLASWRKRSRQDQLNEASKHVERPETLASYSSEAVALRTVLGPLVCGRFALEGSNDEDPLLSSIAEVAKRAIQDRGDFGVALPNLTLHCRASSSDVTGAPAFSSSRLRRRSPLLVVSTRLVTSMTCSSAAPSTTDGAVALSVGRDDAGRTSTGICVQSPSQTSQSWFRPSTT